MCGVYVMTELTLAESKYINVNPYINIYVYSYIYKNWLHLIYPPVE